jgi:hypothetical protein
MRKLLVFFTGIFFYLQFVEVQAQNPFFARHYWLNPMGVNYTLSVPTTNGEWIVAAPRNERLSQPGVIPPVYAARKNTIAVLKVNNLNYAIVSPNTNLPSDEVSIIGMQQGTSNSFNQDVEFEVHCVVQSINPDTAYVLCGSISEVKGDTVGMVAVLNSKLELTSLRRYDEVKVFYSVYAQDGFYFVCGQMGNAYNRKGIVLRDSITNPIPATLIRAFQTSVPWVFHKIAVRKDPAYAPPNSSYYEFSVSGYEDIDEDEAAAGRNRKIGYAVFEMPIGGTLGYLSGLWFTPQIHNGFPINSKTTFAYYPPEPTLPQYQGTGLLLSVSTASDLYTYVFNDNQNPIFMDAAFRIPWDNVLEDMDCGNEYGNANKHCGVAWVGNNRNVYPHRADYIRTDVYSYPYPLNGSPYSTSASLITFLPYNKIHDAYYSLHKVHYYPANNGGDNYFHAGGYYHSGNDPNNQCGNSLNNRTTFAVTPELLPPPDNFPCKEQINIPVYMENEIIPTEFFMGPVRIDGQSRPKLTLWFGFCTMNCEGKKEDDCGNRKINK